MLVKCTELETPLRCKLQENISSCDMALRVIGISIEVFRMIKCAKTLLLLFCKAVYVKAAPKWISNRCKHD